MPLSLRLTCLGAALLLAACTQEKPVPQSASSASGGSASIAPMPPVAATIINDQRTAEKLRGNQGLTLQWISWDYRGKLEVAQRGDVMHLSGSQAAKDGDGLLTLTGDVTRIDADSFILNGTLTIRNTPDANRDCRLAGPMTFAITQNRQYFRMRKFEWCDGLTDYIDIYF